MKQKGLAPIYLLIGLVMLGVILVPIPYYLNGYCDIPCPSPESKCSCPKEGWYLSDPVWKRVFNYFYYINNPTNIGGKLVTVTPPPTPSSNPESSSAAETTYFSVNDKLEDQLGKTITVIGTPVNIYGPYIKNYIRTNNGWEEKNSTCLSINDDNLNNIFYKYATANMSSKTRIKVTGVVEKEILDFGECVSPKAQCGKHLNYCLKAVKIEPQ